MAQILVERGEVRDAADRLRRAHEAAEEIENDAALERIDAKLEQLQREK